MRFTSKVSLLLAVLCTVFSAALAQTKTNPVTGINWPMITGSGAPTTTGASCLAANYGQSYQNTAVTPNTRYHCATAGWELESTTPGTGCAGGNTIANGCTGATTAAGAGLNLTGLPRYPVSAYGAVPYATQALACSGATDSTSAIQAAINAAAVTGGVAVLQPGWYKTSSALSITTSNTGLIGALGACDDFGL
jgi:hypothetical protein